MVTEELLNQKADDIEKLLRLYRINVNVTGGIVAPKSIVFSIQAAVGVKVSSVTALANKIAKAIAVKELNIYRQGAEIKIYIPRNRHAPDTETAKSVTKNQKTQTRHESARIALRNNPFIPPQELVQRFGLNKGRAEAIREANLAKYIAEYPETTPTDLTILFEISFEEAEKLLSSKRNHHATTGN